MNANQTWYFHLEEDNQSGGKKAAKVEVSKDGAFEDEVAIAGAAKDGAPIGRIGSSSTDKKSL